MAIPPIISNIPIFKLFRSEKPVSNESSEIKPEGSSMPQDVVNISVAATEKLEGTKALSLDNAEELRAVLGETRHILASSGQSLGLNPDFE